MKLSQMQLKRIIRKTLNESVWMMNDGMGGPEDQASSEARRQRRPNRFQMFQP